MLSPSRRRDRLLAGALLAAPILCLCAPFLLTTRRLAAHDFDVYYGPHAERVREEFGRSGELVRWNPWQYAGTPFLGSGQNNFYYPPNALFLALPAPRAFGILVALHLLLAAGGMYRLARSFGLRRDAAVLSGLAMAMSFCGIARIDAGHLPHVVTVCQAPLIVLLLRRAIDRPGLRTLGGLATGGALAILGGYPQFVYQLGLLCAAVAAWELHVRRRSGRRLLPAVGALGGAVVGAIALSAVHLLPLLEAAAGSSRARMSGELLGPFHDFGLSHLVLLTVPRFFWRGASDPWLVHEKAMYFGLLPLALAGWAFRSRNRGPVLLFGGIALVVLLEALTGAVFSRLPWYGGFRIPERIVWIAVLCLSLLAGFGWNEWTTSERPVPGLRLAGIWGGAAGAWALLLGLGCQARAGTVLFLAAAAGALAALLAARRWPLAAAVVVALDLGSAGLLQFRTVPPDPGPPSAWYESAIGSSRSAFRVLDLTTYQSSPVAGGFRLLRGYGHPLLRETEKLYASAWTEVAPDLDTLPTGNGLRDVSILRDLNVRWMIAGGEPPGREWTPIFRQGGLTLYEDRAAREEAFLLGGGGSVAFERTGANRISLTVQAERPGILVVSEAWAPGWIARVDGRAVEIGRYRDALMSLETSAGTSEIVLTYSPAGWRWGRWISGIGLIGLVASAILARRLRPV